MGNTPRLSVNVPVLSATSENDKRVGHLLGDSSMGGGFALIGFPVDDGVVRNRGRPGAAAAPSAIRDALYRLTPDARNAEAHTEILRRGCNLGDLVWCESLSASQEALAAVVCEQFRNGIVPIVIGGGHETSFGHLLGYRLAGILPEVINLDAHTDVRPLIDNQGHSGSSFFQGYESSPRCMARYSVFGASPEGVAAAHAEYVMSHGGTIVWRDDATAAKWSALLATTTQDLMVSFDIDVISAASAPGASRPGVPGIAPEIVLNAAYEAGRCARVRSIDIVEVNPSFDRDGITARLAALIVWEFTRGLSVRGKK